MKRGPTLSPAIFNRDGPLTSRESNKKLQTDRGAAKGTSAFCFCGACFVLCLPRVHTHEHMHLHTHAQIHSHSLALYVCVCMWYAQLRLYVSAHTHKCTLSLALCVCVWYAQLCLCVSVYVCVYVLYYIISLRDFGPCKKSKHSSWKIETQISKLLNKHTQ